MAEMKWGTLTKFEIEIWVEKNGEWNRTQQRAQEETESLDC